MDKIDIKKVAILVGIAVAVAVVLVAVLK